MSRQIHACFLAAFLCASQCVIGYQGINEFPSNVSTAQTWNEGSNFVFSAELLYLKPSIEQSSFVISSSNNVVSGEFFPDGKRHHNASPYKPGFRLEGLYKLCDCNALDLRFAYFNTSHSSTVRGNFLFDTIGFPGDGAQAPEDTSYAGKAHHRDHYKYYAVDATFNRLSLCVCIDNLYLLIGLHYANIEHTTHFKSTGNFSDHGVLKPVNNTLRSRSRFWGIGPELGLDYTYAVRLPQCCTGSFALIANIRGALLCSDTRARFHYRTLRTAGTRGVNLLNGDHWRVIPMVDARLGGSYDFCVCGFKTAIEVGYEWIWYHNSIDAITGTDVAFAGDSLDVYSNLSLHGPYLRLNVDF